MHFLLNPLKGTNADAEVSSETRMGTCALPFPVGTNTKLPGCFLK